MTWEKALEQTSVLLQSSCVLGHGDSSLGPATQKSSVGGYFLERCPPLVKLPTLKDLPKSIFATFGAFSKDGAIAEAF